MGRPKPPLLPVSTDFYLSVLAGTAQLPSLLMVVNPKGEGGAIAGFGVPMSHGTSKEDLARPLERGVYALSTPDRKTVLKLRVLSKEEAGFNPEGVLSALSSMRLDSEVVDRVRATWSILQLTFEAFDPGLYPSLDFVTQVASRLASQTNGVVADPLAGQYRLPSHYPSVKPPGEPFVVTDHVSVMPQQVGNTLRLQTAGLAKFAQPELVLSQVPTSLESTALSFIFSICAGVLRGKIVEPGDRLVSLDGWIAGGSPDQNPLVPIIELLPVKGSVEDALSKLRRLP